MFNSQQRRCAIGASIVRLLFAVHRPNRINAMSVNGVYIRWFKKSASVYIFQRANSRKSDTISVISGILFLVLADQYLLFEKSF